MAHSIQIRREKRGLGHKESGLLIKRAIRAALKAEGIKDDCSINVLLTDDAGIHAVNLDMRGVDRPTDVLSFPMNDMAAGEFCADECEYDFEHDCVYLGDMVISLERCQAQGEEFGHGFERELSYLTVHSLLHLLGYDHLDEGTEKRKMRGREDAVMSAMGL